MFFKMFCNGTMVTVYKPQHVLNIFVACCIYTLFSNLVHLIKGNLCKQYNKRIVYKPINTRFFFFKLQVYKIIAFIFSVQDSMELVHKQSKAVAVTSMSFPVGDVNNFVVGSEEGSVYTACRHGRYLYTRIRNYSQFSIVQSH